MKTASDLRTRQDGPSLVSRDRHLNQAIQELESIDAGRHRDSKKYERVIAAIDMLHRVSSPFYDKALGSKTDLGRIREAYGALVEACDAYMKGKGSERSSSYGTQRLHSIRAIHDIASRDLGILQEDHPAFSYGLNMTDLLQKARGITAVVERPDSIGAVGAKMSERLPLSVRKSDSEQKGFFTESTPIEDSERIALKISKRLKNESDLQPLASVLESSRGGELIDRLLRFEDTDFQPKNEQKEQSRFARLFHRNSGKSAGKDTPATMKSIGEFLESLPAPKPEEFSSKRLNQWLKNPKVQEAFREAASEARRRKEAAKISLGWGISEDSDIPSRNIAVARVADLMGMKGLVAPAEKMAIHIGSETRYGVFMHTATGSDISRLSPSDPLATMFHNNDITTEVLESGSLKRNLADLQVLDYICGNVDRHLGNMIYQTAMDPQGRLNVTGVIGIDNDLSFGDLPANHSEFVKPASFKVMTRATMDTILQITPQALSHQLADLGYEKTEIGSAIMRLQAMKSYLSDPANLFAYDPSVTPEFQLPYAKNKLLIVPDESSLQRIPLEAFASENNYFSRITKLPRIVKDRTQQMYDSSRTRAIEEAAEETRATLGKKGGLEKWEKYEEMRAIAEQANFERNMAALDQEAPIKYTPSVMRSAFMDGPNKTAAQEGKKKISLQELQGPETGGRKSVRAADVEAFRQKRAAQRAQAHAGASPGVMRQALS